jgi:AcrR family transcriptional regulator
MSARADDRNSAQTRRRLLDVAENLFGRNGYDGTGMRKLAADAGVNLAAAAYHFGSKQALFVETFFRRFRPANADGLRLLGDAERSAGGRPLPVETVVDCMIRPHIALGFEHPHFHLLVVRTLFSPPPFLLPALRREAVPHVEAFFNAFRRSLPKLPADVLHLRMQFVMGGPLLLAVPVGRPAAARRAGVQEAVLRELIRFVAAGLESPPATNVRRRPPLPRPLGPGRP